MQLVCKTTFSRFGGESVRPIQLNRYSQASLLKCSLSLN